MFTQSSSLGLQIAFLIGIALPLSSVRLSNPRTRLSKHLFEFKASHPFVFQSHPLSCLPPTGGPVYLGPPSRGSSPERHCSESRGWGRVGPDPRAPQACAKQTFLATESPPKAGPRTPRAAEGQSGSGEHSQARGKKGLCVTGSRVGSSSISPPRPHARL